MKPETMKHAISCMIDEIADHHLFNEKESIMEMVDDLCSRLKDEVNVVGYVDSIKEENVRLLKELIAHKEAHHNYRHQVHLVGQHKDEKIAELQSLLAANSIEETSAVLGWDHSLADFAVTDRIKKYLDLQHELALSMNTIYNIQMDDSSASCGSQEPTYEKSDNKTGACTICGDAVMIGTDPLCPQCRYNISKPSPRNTTPTHYCEACFNEVVPEQRIKDIVCPECRSCNHALTPLDNTEELCDNDVQPTKEL